MRCASLYSFEVTGGRLNAALEVSGRTGVGDGFGNVTLFGGARTTGLPARIELNHGGTLRIHGLVADAGDADHRAHKDNVLRNTAFPIATSASAIADPDGISGARARFSSNQRAPDLRDSGQPCLVHGREHLHLLR
ncbi:MAG: hypothetical protein R3F11_26370 [Verrucomicrobiales bacterium]